MFTGIVEATAAVIGKTPTGVTVERSASFDDLKLGSSISVSGICLSIVELTPSSMRFDVVPETLSKTTISAWKKGDRVNLERAMKVSDRLDGHIVQGHVEGVGLVLNNPKSKLHIRIPINLMNSVSPKGSIALDGVSLTIAEQQGGHIWIALIPHTFAETTLGSLRAGDHVNIETDVMVRAGRTGYPLKPDAQ